MKQSFINTEHIEGRVYEHNLSIKTVQNEKSANFGKEFISGTLDVATDEEGLNVLTVHFTYVTEFTKSGGKNQTYVALQRIINEGKTWIADGKDAATKVKIDTNLALNDFYAQDDSLVSVKTNEGGFVTIVNELCDPSERNTFTMDMIITAANTVEANEDKGITAPYISLRGAVFNFRKDVLPVDFFVKNPAGMKYFEDAEISGSNPLFTKVWGKILSATSTVERTEESAFGEAAVKTYERKTKEWVVTGTAKIPYDFGDETVLTSDELVAAMQNREVYLADIKKRSDEYRANRAASANAAFSSGSAMNMPTGSAPEAKKGTFNF